MKDTKNANAISFEKCLTAPIETLGVPQGIAIILIALASIGFIAYRSMTIAAACLIFYFIVLVIYRHDRQFVSILQAYLKLDDCYYPEGEKAESSYLSDLFSWGKPIGHFRGGLILENKDGTFQASSEIKQLIDPYSTPEEIVQILKILNKSFVSLSENNIKLVFDRHKMKCKPQVFEYDVPYNSLTTRMKSFLSDRQAAFSKNDILESKLYFTVIMGHCPHEKLHGIKNIFIDAHEGKLNDVEFGVDHFREILGKIASSLSLVANSQIIWLSDRETAQYFSKCVNPIGHTREICLGNDFSKAIPKQSIRKGTVPVFGNKKYIKSVGLKDFPEKQGISLGMDLNNLDFPFRHCTAIEVLQSEQALNIAKKISTRLENNSIKFVSEIKAILFSEMYEGGYKDYEYSLYEEAENVVSRLMRNEITLCNYSSSFFVLDKNENRAIDKCNKIKRLLTNKGFDSCIESLNTLTAWISAIPQPTSINNPRNYILTSEYLVRLLSITTAWRGVVDKDTQSLIIAKGRD